MRRFIAQAALVTLILTGPLHDLLQAETLKKEGIANDVDKHHRNPMITVTTSNSDAGVKILADAAIINKEFEQYPVRVDFFINRRLFSSQYRSSGLPGALGVDIGPDIAVPPFNYSVVATILHPNRQYSSVLEGAVFTSSLSGESLSCSVTLTYDDASEHVFSAENVSATQSGNNAVTVTFEGSEDSSGDKATPNLTLTISGETATATGTITKNSDTPSEVSLSGSAVLTEGALTSFSVSSTDQATTVECQ
ncbi:MAG: hypothetical protein K1X83_12700 [Oligoflexia bacterium]|nr:hypothetical protein [Oligoflexia bacterium]